MTERIQIRPALPEDAPGIAHVHVATWRTAYRDLVPAALLAGLDEARRERNWREHVTKPDPGVGVFVAEDAWKGIVGFVSGGPERDGIAGYAGEMYALYVLASEHGRGIGRALVGAMARHLVHVQGTSMLVWVLASNPACAFYEHLGGTPVAHKQDRRGDYVLDEVGYGWADVTPLIL